MGIRPVNPGGTPVGSGNPNPFFLGLNTTFNATFATPTVPVWATKIAQMYPASSEVEGFGWTDPAKRARKWVGPRSEDQLGPRTYYVAVEPYEKTIKVDLFDLNDDRYGLYLQWAMSAANMLAKEPDYQMRDLLLNQGAMTGAYQIGVDGLSHFNASHPVNYYDAAYGVYNNDYRGASGVGGIGGPLAMQAYVTARYDMETRKAAHGEAAGINPNLLMHSSYLDA